LFNLLVIPKQQYTPEELQKSISLTNMYEFRMCLVLYTVPCSKEDDDEEEDAEDDNADNEED
jgi:hypothetical protein